MAAAVSEIVYITLKPGVDLEGSTTEASSWKKALEAVEAVDGYRGSYWDWQSHQKHLDFINDPSYTPFRNHLVPIMDAVYFHHAETNPPSVIGKAPCTEVATFYDCEESFLQNVAKFSQALDAGQPDSYFGNAYGQVIEQVLRHGDFGKEGVKAGTAVVLLIGWESKGAHIKFRDTELFKENIGLLREKNKGAEMFHVPFKNV